MPESGQASGSGSGQASGSGRTQETHESITVQTSTTQPPPPPPTSTDVSKIYIDKVETLEGRSNYEDWSYQLLMVWRAMHATKVVVEGIIPSNRATAAEKAAYNHINEQAILILMQVVSKTILKEIAQHETPYAIWRYLKDTYFVDSPITFIYELQNLTNLMSSLTDSMNLADFIKQFETQWNRLYNLTSTGLPERASMRTYMDFDQNKRDLLMASLLKYYANPIDNLSTKPNLKYTDLKHHMLALSTNQSIHKAQDDSIALLASNKKDKNWKRNQTGKVCTFCKRRGYNALGHTWKECRKLKKRNELNTQSNQSSTGPNALFTVATALVSTISASTSDAWKIDTCATSHMTSDIGCFLTLIPSKGTVMVGGNNNLPIEGTGTVLLNCAPPDGSTNQIILHSVLYVPTLGHSLISWNSISSKVALVARDNLFQFYMNNDSDLVNPVMVADLRNNLPYVRESSTGQPTASLALPTSFALWHEALGHSAKIQPTAYADGNILPTLPSTFLCTACIMAKSVNSSPATLQYERTTQPFHLIHSDLSGKQPTPSYGNSYYYITFIDNYTRMGWIFYLKNKSDAYPTMQNFVTFIERQHNTKILCHL